MCATARIVSLTIVDITTTVSLTDINTKGKTVSRSQFIPELLHPRDSVVPYATFAKFDPVISLRLNPSVAAAVPPELGARQDERAEKGATGPLEVGPTSSLDATGGAKPSAGSGSSRVNELGPHSCPTWREIAETRGPEVVRRETYAVNFRVPRVPEDWWRDPSFPPSLGALS